MAQPDTQQPAGAPAAPAAPSAPPVAPRRMPKQKFKKIAHAIKSQPKAFTVKAQKMNRVAPGNNNRPGQEKPKFTKEQTAALEGLNDTFKEFNEKGVGTGNVTFPANPYGENKEDPRGPDYWANVAALDANYAAELAYIDRDQLDDDIETNMTAMELAEYNRRRKRDMGEARLGTGSAYTGQARRDQTENDVDYMTDSMRRDRQKSRRDYDREFERGRLAAQLAKDKGDLYANAAQDAADQKADQSANSSGDAEPPKGEQGNNKPNAQKQKQQKIRNQMAAITKQIQQLRNQMQKTKNPKQKQKLRNQIDRLQKKRAQLQGKLGKNTTA